MDPQHTAIARLFVLLFLIINQTSSRSDGPRYRLRSRRSKQALMLLCWPLPLCGPSGRTADDTRGTGST